MVQSWGELICQSAVYAIGVYSKKHLEWEISDNLFWNTDPED